MAGPIRINRQPPVKSIVSFMLGQQISMTNPRSSLTLRSNRVENLQRGEVKRQKLKAADIAECIKLGSESVSAGRFPRRDLLRIDGCKVVEIFVKLDLRIM